MLAVTRSSFIFMDSIKPRLGVIKRISTLCIAESQWKVRRRPIQIQEK